MADIEHVTKWMEAAAKEVASLEKMEPGNKSVSLKPRPRFFQGLGYFGTSNPQMERLPSTRRATVFEATVKKENLKPMPQLLLRVQFGCSSSCPQHWDGKHAPLTSAVPLTKPT